MENDACNPLVVDANLLQNNTCIVNSILRSLCNRLEKAKMEGLTEEILSDAAALSVAWEGLCEKSSEVIENVHYISSLTTKGEFAEVVFILRPSEQSATA